MTYLLDTNACVAHLKHPGRSGVAHQLSLLKPSDVVLCSVVKAELIYGALRSRDAGRNLTELQRFLARFTSLPFDDRAAEEYGRIRAELALQGTPIGPNDLMIAAIALANAVTLVTHNVGEFGRVTGLALQDWETEGQTGS